jgi:PAS domain S-box-containing protein
MKFSSWASRLAAISRRDWLDPILDQLPVGFIIIEAPSGRVLEGNQQLERIFRHPMRYSAGVADYGEWVGYHPDGRVYAPADWPIARALTGEVTQGEEIAIDRGDGTRGYISVDAAPIRDEHDRIVAALAIIQDITERRLAEEQARQASRRFYDVLESTTDCVFVLDRQWRFTLLNSRAIEEISGGRDLTGEVIWDAFPDARASAFEELYRKVMNERQPGSMEAYYPPAAGWYDVHAFPSDEGIAVFFRNITAAKNAVETERRSRQSLYSALAAARAITFEWDLTTGHTVRSENAQEILGIGSGPDEHFISLIHPDDQHLAEETFKIACSRGTAEGVEFRFTKPNGEEIWLSAHMKVEFDEAGKPVRAYGIDQDITERKRAEEQIKYQASLLDAVEQAVIATDLQGKIVFYNRFAERLYGWTREEALGRNVIDLVAGSDPEKAGAMMAFLANGGSWSGEFIVRRKDGSTFPGYVTDAPIYDALGQQIGIVGISKDITERRRAEEQLRLRNRALAATIHGMFVADATQPDIPITYVNPAFERLTGYSSDEIVGRNCRFLQGPKTEPDVVRQMREAVHAGRSFQSTLTNYRKDGTPFVNEVTISPVHDEEGKLTHFVGTQSDVTNRIGLEEQLRQAQKMEAVGQLTGGIAHDFNNLLTVILGNAELLAEAITDPGLQALARMTEETALRAAELTKKLLAFGRRQTLKPEPLALDEVAHGMVGLLKRTLGEHIEVRIATKDSQSAALTDRTLLESAILNLAVNARDAMPQGGTLTIATGERLAGLKDGSIPAGQPVVFLTVSDTGTGMTPDVLAHAFEPFFTTKDVGQGTGLGLAMVHGFAAQSGGHVSISSQAGKGTSVTLVLRAVGKEIREPSLSQNEVARAARGRVLAVEDEANVRQFVEGQVRALGYEVLAVGDAREALDVLEGDHRFDLLFTDVVLPKGTSGVALARRVSEAYPEIKVLLTSGYSEEVFEQHGRPPDGTLLLRKPYRRKELAETIRKVLEA